MNQTTERKPASDFDDAARLRLLIAQLGDVADHLDKHGVEVGLERWNEASVSALLRKLANQSSR